MSENIAHLVHFGELFGQYLDDNNIGTNEAGRRIGVAGSQISRMVKGKKFGSDKLIATMIEFPDFAEICLESFLPNRNKDARANAHLKRESSKSNESQGTAEIAKENFEGWKVLGQFIQNVSNSQSDLINAIGALETQLQELKDKINNQ